MCDRGYYSGCERRCGTIRLCPTPYISNCCSQPPIVNDIAYVDDIVAPTTITAGGAAIAPGTVIAPGSTIVPAGTVTAVTGFGAPSTNIGGIVLNNGFLTIPITARVGLSATVTFDTAAAGALTDVRAVYLYRVAAGSGLVSLLAAQSQIPVTAEPTHVNVATEALLSAGDRVFLAVRAVGAAPLTVTGGRLAIFKL